MSPVLERLKVSDGALLGIDSGSGSVHRFVIPGVTVLQEIGRGASGIVFEAVDNLNRRVALKVWCRSVSTFGTAGRSNRSRMDRAWAEAQKLATLGVNPLLVVLYRFDVANGFPYAVMEYVEGTSVKQWLTMKAQPLQDRATVWSLFSSALRAAYKIGVCHGDPHTGNILVFEDRDRRYEHLMGPWLESPSGLGLKLLDFGTSRIWRSRKPFEERETRVLVETAGRLFDADSLERTVDLSGVTKPELALDALDLFARLHVKCLWPRGKPSPLVLDGFDVARTPLMRLDGVLNLVRSSRASIKEVGWFVAAILRWLDEGGRPTGPVTALSSRQLAKLNVTDLRQRYLEARKVYMARHGL